MDMMRTLADHSIRRALSFAGLGVVTLMLALSYDLPLALRTGGNLLALVCLGLLFAAWRAPRRNLRRSELWSLLLEHAAPLARSLPAAEAQRLMSSTLRQRLVWHADSVGRVALALWVVAMLLALVNG
ncbi:hypothetical protein [Falsiroseomonas selenitidurans]|uniref:Uncharacterized protein n=1 Tax=Falsiroseomonas selenitidurans TaxID=2716335 RepID=A0ABX1DXA1_9PROT|nr:hypothetical protein [Falsiroseomonas selenitidurans]NKC29526.1 hypothetical protein [Falsiroseomonas selenitidurans]